MNSLREIVARNLAAALYRERLKQPGLVRLGIPAGTAHRIMTGQNMTLHVLEKAANAVRSEAWELLHPRFDANRPLLVKHADEWEREVKRRVEEAFGPLASLIGALRDQTKPGTAVRYDGESATDSPPATGDASRRHGDPGFTQGRKPRE